MFGTGSTDVLQMFGKICVRFDLVTVEFSKFDPRISLKMSLLAVDVVFTLPTTSRLKLHMLGLFCILGLSRRATNNTGIDGPNLEVKVLVPQSPLFFQHRAVSRRRLPG